SSSSISRPRRRSALKCRCRCSCASTTRSNKLASVGYSLMPAMCRWRTSLRVRSRGSQDVISLDWAANPLQWKLADRFDRYSLVNLQQNARADEDLTRLRLIAKTRRDIGYCANRGIVEAALKPNGAECREAMCNADSEA